MEKNFNLDLDELKNNKIFFDCYKNIVECNNEVLNNFILIGKYLKTIKENSYYKLLNYENIYDFSKNEFNYSLTTTKNMIAVFDKFVEPTTKSSFRPELLKKFDGYNYSQLVELLPVEESKLESFDSNMTVKEIRIKKLENKLNKDIDKVNSYFSGLFFETIKEIVDKENFLKIRLSSSNYIDISVKNKDISNFYFTIQLYTYDSICLNVSTYVKKYESYNIDLDLNILKKHLNTFINICKAEIERYNSSKSQLSDLDILEIKEKKSNLKNFKNNDERYNFLKNLENYNLIYSLDLIKVKIYQNKYFEELYIITSLSNDSIYDYFWFSGNYYFFYQTCSCNELYSKLESKKVNLNEK